MARVLRGVVWVALGAFALALSVVYHLDTPSGRRAVCREVAGRVSAAIAGELRLRCAELSPWRVRLEALELWEPGGRRVVQLEAVELRPDLDALLRGHLRARSLRLERPLVDLRAPQALAAAVTPTQPSPPSDEPLVLPRAVVDSLTLAGGSVRLPDGWDLRDLALDAAVALGPAAVVELRALEVGAEHGQEPVGQASVRGQVDLGGRSDLALEIRAGEDRVAGAVGVQWGTLLLDGPQRWEADLTGAVSSELLRRLGLPEVAPLIVAPVQLAASAEGTLEDVAGEVRLDTAGGTLRAEASYDAQGWLRGRVQTRELGLRRALRLGVGERVAGDVEFELGPDTSGRALRVRGRDLRFDEWVAPELAVRGVLADDRLEVEAVDAPHLSRGGHLDVRGTVGFDGAIDLRVRARLPQVARDANLRRLAPGLAGALGVDGRVRWAGGRLDAAGSASVEGLSYRGARVRRAEVRGSVRGSLTRPRAELVLEAEGLERGDVRVSRAHLAVRGGPSGGRRGEYAVRGELTERRGSVGLDVRVGTTPRRLQLDGRLTSDAVWTSPVVAELRGLTVGAGALGVERLRVRAGDGLDLDVAGVVRERGSHALTFEVRALDLAELDRRLGLGRGLTGGLRATGALRGTAEAPQAEVHAHVEALGAVGWPAASVDADLRLEQAAAGARVDGEVRVTGPLAAVELRGGAQLAGPDPTGGWSDAVYGVHAHVRELDLATALAPFGELPVAGTLGAQAQLRGTLTDPRLELRARATSFTVEGGDPLELRLRAVLEDGRLDASARGGDAAGELLEVTTRLDEFDPRAASLEALMQRPLEVVVRLAPRRLDRLPRPWRMEQALTARGTLTLRDGWRAGLRARVQHAPELMGCAGRLPSQLRVLGELADGRVRVEARGDVARRERFALTATAAAPVQQWFASGFPAAIPSVDVRARGRDLELSAVPELCRLVEGRASVDLEARRLFTPDATLRLQARVPALVVQGAEPLDLQLNGSADAGRVQAQAMANVGGREVLRGELAAPLRWEAGAPPSLGAGPWTARLRLDAMPVAPVLAPVSLVAQPSGAVDGDLRLRGSGSEVRARGIVDLRSVSLTVRDPFLRIEDLRGRLRLGDGRLDVVGLRYRDREGRLRADGHVTLAGWTPIGAELALRARQMPLRVEGVTYAVLDAEVDVEARSSEVAHDVEVRLRDVAVRVPRTVARRVQSLRPHPDLVYVDDVGFEVARARAWAPSAPPSSSPPPTRTASVPLRVHVHGEPFWVRREDFAAQLRADLRIEVDESVRISGPVEVRRGFIELLGKNFDFQTGEIRFAGGHDVDPRLELSAVHTLRTGETVTVFISGPLSRPQLRFASTVPGAESEREILTLLVRGRSDSSLQTAQEQATSALAGLMAGFLSSLTRTELGRYVPVFRLESQGANSARVRAGFNADRLLPDVLRGVVEGVYVEGFVGTEQDQSTSSQQVTGGFLIELLFPRSIVGRGTYQQPSNWSVDLTWEPL